MQRGKACTPSSRAFSSNQRLLASTYSLFAILGGRLMMFWHNGKIHQVVVGEVLHIVGMVHGAVVYLSGTYLLHTVIIVECSRSAYHKHHLAVALVGMQSCGSSRTKCRIHDLHLVVHEVSSVQLSFSSLEALEMSLSNFFKIYYHIFIC